MISWYIRSSIAWGWLVIGVLAMIPGCTELQQGIDMATTKGAKAVAAFVQAECRRSPAVRESVYFRYRLVQTQINTGTLLPKAKVLPFDCDGDDKPDFSSSRE